jgi:caffeoyl-CoA O-methyltransferase
MVVDNALWSGKIICPQDKDTRAIDALNQKARHDPSVETVMLSVRDGILLIRKRSYSN